MTRQIFHGALLVSLAAAAIPKSADAQSDPKARQIAEATIEAMGGMDEWNDRRYFVWDIFGESHYWDKWNGDFRWEADSLTVLMNIESKTGDAWIDGSKVDDSAQEKQILDRAYQRWVNNSYWVIMPFKLLDPGVMLDYVGMDTSAAGEVSDVIEMTFENVGLTPQNKYHVYVDRTSGMVCQWEYYRTRDDREPSIVNPWNDWKEYNGVWMSTGRGPERSPVTNVSLPDELPRSVFTDPGPVQWRP